MSKDTDNTVLRSMVLCAGLGTRMQPLTLTTPKPLINVAGKPLLEYGTRNLEKAGIETIIINVHYLAEQVEDWAHNYHGAEILLSDEKNQLLETGGGVCHAKAMLGNDPLFVLNSDSFWLDRPEKSSLKAMMAFFDKNKCDFLLLLTTHDNAIGFDGPGDFFCGDDAKISRRGEATKAPFIYAGCYLFNPAVLHDCPSGKFSMNVLWDRAIKQNRVMGFVHDGLWLHVGTPQAIAQTEKAIKNFDHDPL